MSSSPSPSLAVGGRYRVVGPGGSLPYAELYVAEIRGLEGFIKRVSLVEVLPELCRREAVAALLADVRRLSQLSIWGLGQILDVLTEGSGSVVLVTEHPGGLALAEAGAWAQRRREALPLEAVLSVGLAVASSLAVAHDQPEPVLHGDLRPEQIVLMPEGTTKLMGFGFGRFLSLAAPDGEWCLWQGRCYQPAERVQGAPPDVRSEIFSLGCVLVEAATGRPPHGSTDPAQLRERLRAGRSPIPDDAALPGDVERVLARACSPRAEERHAGMDELAAELHRLLARRGRRAGTGLARAMVQMIWEGRTVRHAAPEAEAGRLRGDPTLPRRAPFVGRDPIFEQVRQAVARLTSGSGEAILLRGEPGVGRSRLLAEIVERLAVEQPGLVALRVGAGPEDRVAPHRAVLRLLATSVGLPADVDPRRLTGELGQLRAFGLDTRTLDAIRGLLGVGKAPDPTWAAGLLSQALIHCVSGLSWERPTLVVWDDLEHTDEESLRALADLVDELALVPALVLASARSGFELPWGVRRPTELELGPLAEEQCAELILARRPGATRLDPALLRTVVTHSGGNPLLVEELLDLLGEVDRIELDGGVLSLRGEPTAPLPMLEEVVGARLRALGRPAHDLALVLALAPADLDLAAMADVAGLDLVEAERQLEHLAWLRRRLRLHERVRGAVLASGDPEWVRALRLALARALLAGAERDRDRADRAAGLMARAGDVRAAVGVLLDTASAQEARGDLRGAADRFHQAWQLARKSAELQGAELEICLRLGRAAVPSLRLEPGGLALERAVALADASGNDRAAAEARVLLCRLRAREGRLSEAVEHAKAAIPIAERGAERGVLGSAYTAVAETLQQLGAYGPDLRYIEEALRIASDAGDLHRLGECLQLAVMHAAGVGQYERTQEYLERAQAIADAARDPVLACQLLKARGLLLFFRGSPREALRTNLEGVALARRHGIAEVEIVMLHNAGDDHLALGELDEALFYFGESLRRSRAVRFDRLTEANEMFVGFLEAGYLGNPEGLERLRGAIDSATRRRRIWNLAQGEQLLGRVLLARHDREALEHLERALHLSEKTGVRFFIEEARRWYEQGRETFAPAQGE